MKHSSEYSNVATNGIKLQTQPNNWSCLPTAFAMVAGIPVEVLIAKIGHDGSEVIWPHLADPFRRKSFHPQEILTVMYDMGMSVIEFQAMPCLAPPIEFGGRVHTVYDQQTSQDRLTKLLGQKGVLTGKVRNNSHAVAWNGKCIFDPNGSIYAIDSFTVSSFWMVK